MAIRVSWCNKQTGILCWTFDGGWSWVHFRRAMNETRALCETYDGRIDLIIDVREMGLPPANLISGFGALANLDFSFRQDGINVLVGMDSYLRLLWNVLEKRLPQTWHVYYTGTLEDAHQIICNNRRDQTIDSQTTQDSDHNAR